MVRPSTSRGRSAGSPRTRSAGPGRSARSPVVPARAPRGVVHGEGRRHDAGEADPDAEGPQQVDPGAVGRGTVCSAVWVSRSEMVACREARAASSFASAARSDRGGMCGLAVCGAPARNALRPDCEAVKADIRLASCGARACVARQRQEVLEGQVGLVQVVGIAHRPGDHLGGRHGLVEGLLGQDLERALRGPDLAHRPEEHEVLVGQAGVELLGPGRVDDAQDAPARAIRIRTTPSRMMARWGEYQRQWSLPLGIVPLLTGIRIGTFGASDELRNGCVPRVPISFCIWDCSPGIAAPFPFGPAPLAFPPGASRRDHSGPVRRCPDSGARGSRSERARPGTESL